MGMLGRNILSARGHRVRPGARRRPVELSERRMRQDQLRLLGRQAPVIVVPLRWEQPRGHGDPRERQHQRHPGARSAGHRGAADDDDADNGPPRRHQGARPDALGRAGGAGQGRVKSWLGTVAHVRAGRREDRQQPAPDRRHRQLGPGPARRAGLLPVPPHLRVASTATRYTSPGTAAPSSRTVARAGRERHPLCGDAGGGRRRTTPMRWPAAVRCPRREQPRARAGRPEPCLRVGTRRWRTTSSPVRGCISRCASRVRRSPTSTRRCVSIPRWPRRASAAPGCGGAGRSPGRAGGPGATRRGLAAVLPSARGHGAALCRLRSGSRGAAAVRPLGENSSDGCTSGQRPQRSLLAARAAQHRSAAGAGGLQGGRGQRQRRSLHHDSLGWTYLRLGDPAKAKRAFDDAIKLKALPIRSTAEGWPNCG